MKRSLLIVCMLLYTGLVQLYAQQDAQFSQYMFNGLYINPAYAGYREQWNINMFYRNQWTGFPGAPKTFSLAADGVANDNRVGLGVQIMNDKIGAQENTSFYGNYAYRIPLNDEGSQTLALGIGAGFLQQRLNINALHDENGAQPTEDLVLINAKKTAIMPDARFGIFFNSDRFYTGLSVDNLITDVFRKNQVLRNYIPMKPHLYFTMGGLVPLSEEILFKPSLLIKEDFAGPTSLDLNAFFLLDQKVWLGASYRTAVLNRSSIEKSITKSGAVVGMIEVFVNDKLRIGYAYDQTVNGTAANNYSTHEISLNYFFNNPRARMLSPRYF